MFAGSNTGVETQYKGVSHARFWGEHFRQRKQLRLRSWVGVTLENLEAATAAACGWSESRGFR